DRRTGSSPRDRPRRDRARGQRTVVEPTILPSARALIGESAESTGSGRLPAAGRSERRCTHADGELSAANVVFSWRIVGNTRQASPRRARSPRGAASTLRGSRVYLAPSALSVSGAAP